MRPRAPTPLRRRDFEQNRARILDAALALAAERGPETLTVSEVAHRAGVNRTTAYQHFRTRDALLGAVMEALGDAVTELLNTPMGLEERIDQTARYFVSRPEIARLALHQLLAENPFPRGPWKRYVAQVERLTTANAGGGAPVEADILAHVLMATALLWSLRVRLEFDDPAAIDRATSRLVAGVKQLLLSGAFSASSTSPAKARTR